MLPWQKEETCSTECEHGEAQRIGKNMTQLKQEGNGVFKLARIEMLCKCPVPQLIRNSVIDEFVHEMKLCGEAIRAAMPVTDRKAATSEKSAGIRPRRSYAMTARGAVRK
jgi:choline kinase